MMSLSRIEWCDLSWNPITGCTNTCPYCYARRQSKRFCGDVRLNKASAQLANVGSGLWVLEKPFHNRNGKPLPYPAGYELTLHKYRFEMPASRKTPANIFVGSMADVFDANVPDEWIQSVFDACAMAPWHNYLFLTKNPDRYDQLAAVGKLPKVDNQFYGTTVTNPDASYFYSEGYNSFLSIEPMQCEFGEPHDTALDFINWVIVGAETGGRKNRILTKREWVEGIVSSCQRAGTPVYLKNNLQDIWNDELIQEVPVRLAHPTWEHKHYVDVNRVRDDKYCEHCGKALKGQPAKRISARFYVCNECFGKRGSANEQEQK